MASVFYMAMVGWGVVGLAAMSAERAIAALL